MKIRSPLFILIMLMIFSESFPQTFRITVPKASFDGYFLSISYDIENANKSDLFNISVDIQKADGNGIDARTFKGDLGDSIKPGRNKTIIWIPSDDGVYIDDEITIEVVGEKYERSFSKGSMILLSTALPGLGQTKISNGKPYWLMGLAGYGAIAGGIITYGSYLNNYDLYTQEIDADARAEYLEKSQNQKELSNVFFVSAAAIWVGNIIWMAATPNRYMPLKNTKPGLSLINLPMSNGTVAMLSLKMNF